MRLDDALRACHGEKRKAEEDLEHRTRARIAEEEESARFLSAARIYTMPTPSDQMEYFGAALTWMNP